MTVRVGSRAILATATLCLAASFVLMQARVAFAANPVQTEESLPGTPGWLLPSPSTLTAVAGYASEVSVSAGQSLELHVSTSPVAYYRVDIYRVGWYGGIGARLESCLPSCGGAELGRPEPAPTPDPVTGLIQSNWPATDSMIVPSTWVSGYYIAELVLLDSQRAAIVPFVVRDSSPTASAILVVAPVDTWEAYNSSGGKSLYPFNSTGGERGFEVSFDRPWDTARGPAPMWEYEIPLVDFLEREGYDVSYATDVDVDSDPGELLRHRLIVVAGHSEYWSTAMRDAYDNAVYNSTNLMFFGADDAYWQIRFSGDRRTIVEYKSSALDPESDPELKTVRFRDLPSPKPECLLMGVDYQGGETSSSSGPYTVAPAAATDPWFRGTGLNPGESIPGVVGYEWDSIQPGCRVPREVVLMSANLTSPADAVRWTAASGARIFATGTLQLGWAIDGCACHPGVSQPVVPGLEQLMRNALADLLRPAPPLHVGLTLHPGAVTVQLTVSPDPRVTKFAVYRHTGSGTFDPAAPGVRLICVAKRPLCVDHRAILASGRRDRYAVVAEDAWGTSGPALSRPTR